MDDDDPFGTDRARARAQMNTDMRSHVVALLGVINSEVRYSELHIQKGSPTDKVIVAAKRAVIVSRPSMSEEEEYTENDKIGI